MRGGEVRSVHMLPSCRNTAEFNITVHDSLV